MLQMTPTDKIWAAVQNALELHIGWGDQTPEQCRAALADVLRGMAITIDPRTIHTVDDLPIWKMVDRRLK